MPASHGGSSVRLSGGPGEIPGLSGALGRVTHLERELYVGWTAFWGLLIVALLWLIALGVDPSRSHDAGLWAVVLLIVAVASALRARIRGDWPTSLGIARRIDAHHYLDNVVVSAWILHQRPELCGSEVIRSALSAQALPVVHEFERIFGRRERRLRPAAAFLILLVLFAGLIWLLRPSLPSLATLRAVEIGAGSGSGPGPSAPDPSAPPGQPSGPGGQSQDDQAAKDGSTRSSAGDDSDADGEGPESSLASGSAEVPPGGDDAPGAPNPSAAKTLSDLREIQRNLGELTGKYPYIDQGGEIEPAREAVDQAMQDPSPDRVQEATEALDRASDSAAQKQSATSTFHGEEAAHEVSDQLRQMAERLRQSTSRKGGGNPSAKSETGTRGGDGSEGGAGTDGEANSGAGAGGAGTGNQAGGTPTGDGGSAAGGDGAGTQPGGNHTGGAAPTNGHPQESGTKLLPRMTGEGDATGKEPKLGSEDPECRREQALADPADPDIIIDADFERRVRALREAGNAGTEEAQSAPAQREDG